MHALNIDDFKYRPPYCTCASSSFIYNPADHVITRDLKIINITYLRDVLAKRPTYRGPKAITWTHNFTNLMDSVQNYARQWAKLKMEDLVTLSKLLKSVRSLKQIRIK